MNQPTPYYVDKDYICRHKRTSYHAQRCTFAFNHFVLLCERSQQQGT